MNRSWKLAACVFTLFMTCEASHAQQTNNYWKSGTAGVFQDWTPVSAATPMPTSSTPTANNGLAASSTAVLASSQIVKAAPGNLYSLEVSADSTLSAAAWWIMVFDSTTLPGDGTVTPKKCFAMASGATSFTAAWPTPVAFTTGIVIGVSTTGCFNKTASVHAFISGDAQ